MLRSTVTSTSKMPAAAFNRSPFSSPFTPASSTVLTSCPTKSRLRKRVTHSSSSNFTLQEPFFREFKNTVHLRTRDGRKLIEKLIDRFPFLKAIKEVLNRHAGSAKHGRAARLLWICFEETILLHPSLRMTMSIVAYVER